MYRVVNRVIMHAMRERVCGVLHLYIYLPHGSVVTCACTVGRHTCLFFGHSSRVVPWFFSLVINYVIKHIIA